MYLTSIVHADTVEAQKNDEGSICMYPYIAQPGAPGTARLDFF